MPLATRTSLFAFPSCLALVLCATGCPPGPEIDDLRRENMRLNERITDQDHQLAAMRATLDGMNRQLAVARALTDEDLESIYYPEKLVIASLSGGDDYDGKPGDDGVTIHLKPVDRDGDTLKVVGDVRIELYDLENPEGHKLIGQYTFPAGEIAEYWYGGFLTYHYSFKCPWQKGPPRHPDITIRATFVDYLTERLVTAQTLCTVKLPPLEPE